MTRTLREEATTKPQPNRALYHIPERRGFQRKSGNCSRLSVALALCSFLASAMASECPSLYPGVEPSPSKGRTIELCSPQGGFATRYSEDMRLPFFSVEHLTRQHMSDRRAWHHKRTDSFRPDERVPERFRAELNDYKHSGYDRGHMAPDADAWSADSEYDTFVLSNMIPQAPANNRGLHAHIEGATRHLANQRGELYVYTGPLFLAKTVDWLHSRIPIPDHLFKLVYDPNKNQAAAYLEQNTDDASVGYTVLTLQELNKIVGYDFLPGRNPTPLDLPVPKGR